MKGHITRLIDDQQLGTIAAEDGIDYLFESVSLFDVNFASLHIGALVKFIGNPKTKRATAVRIAQPIEHLR